MLEDFRWLNIVLTSRRIRRYVPQTAWREPDVDLEKALKFVIQQLFFSSQMRKWCLWILWLEKNYVKGFLFPFKQNYQPPKVFHYTFVHKLGEISVRVVAFKLVLTVTFGKMYFTPLFGIYNWNENFMKLYLLTLTTHEVFYFISFFQKKNLVIGHYVDFLIHDSHNA